MQPFLHRFDGVNRCETVAGPGRMARRTGGEATPSRRTRRGATAAPLGCALGSWQLGGDLPISGRGVLGEDLSTASVSPASAAAT
jgi:hypothetical protein